MNPNYDYAIVSALQHGKGLKGDQQLGLLQKCGEQGWELVAVIPKSDDIWFYFKQPAGIRRRQKNELADSLAKDLAIGNQYSKDRMAKDLATSDPLVIAKESRIKH
jgi:hypothetical protein